ncbi:MAG TPA: hypothetical protein VK453_24300 [Micromonosporaceae bacterium]|nr:hypothetical protein [Micromonosporaceae bacterium]
MAYSDVSYVQVSGDGYESGYADPTPISLNEPHTGAYTYTWWWWYRPVANGTATITASTNTGTNVGCRAYTGDTIDALTSSGAFGLSSSFPVTAGTVYKIQGALDNASGNVKLVVVGPEALATAPAAAPADNRDDVVDIYLPYNGSAYLSPPVDLTRGNYTWEPDEQHPSDASQSPGHEPLTYVPVGDYNPNGLTRGQRMDHGTAWFRYTPATSGTCTFAFPSRPYGVDSDNPYFFGMMYVSDGPHTHPGYPPAVAPPYDGTFMSLTATYFLVDQGLTIGVTGGTTYWFQMAMSGWSIDRQHPDDWYIPQTYAMWFSLTGPSTNALPAGSVHPYLSTLTDTFDSFVAGRWVTFLPASLPYNATVSGGQAVVGAAGQDGELRTQGIYRFDEVRAKVSPAAGATATLRVDGVLGDAPPTAVFQIDRNAATITATWYDGTTSGSHVEDYDPEAHAWLMIVWYDGHLSFSAGPNGYDWSDFQTFEDVAAFGDVTLALGSYGVTHFDNVNVAGATPGTGDPDNPDPDPPPWVDPDPPWVDTPGGDGDWPEPGDPDTIVPAVPADPGGDTRSATVLDLIRAFSAQIRRPVRLTGTTSIEIVDINAPLPAGWAQGDADDLYHSTTRTALAGAPVLSVSAGDLALTADADLAADDVRLPASTWRLPDQLPVFGLRPAPVQRVTYTFTPTKFVASVEFHFPAVPLVVRRT